MMKAYIGFFAIGLTALLVGAISCTNDTVSPSGGNLNFPDDAGWYITRFIDNGNDETSDFLSYTFYFRSGNVFEAVGNGGVVKGTWTSGSDDGAQKLILSTSPDKPLSELNDDWIVVESSQNLVKLRDDNSSRPEQVIFERE